MPCALAYGALLTLVPLSFCHQLVWSERITASSGPVQEEPIQKLRHRPSTKVTAGITHHVEPLKRQAEQALSASAGVTPQSIVPLDLWAIHDLLLAGHSAPLMEAPHAVGTAPITGPTQVHPGKSLVQAAAVHLAGMLHLLHPVPACRQAIGDESSFDGKAAAAWSCLDLSAGNFTGAITSDSDSPSDVSNPSPSVLLKAKLGACAESQWPRACSYWVSMHAMAVRAEMIDRGQEYLQSVIRIISGGALYCFGCTSHFMFLNRHLLPAKLRSTEKLWVF